MASRKVKRALAFLVAGLVLCLLACNGDKPSEPGPPPPTPKDYSVYFCAPARTPPQLFAYHPLTRQTDSVDIHWRPKVGLTISADGKRLYLAQRNSIVVVDADSFDVITELPYKGHVAVSPDNRLVAITGLDIRILSTLDYSTIFYDTSSTSRSQFSHNSKRLYCVGAPGVIKIDLSDTLYQITRKTITTGSVRKVVPSLDESKWFLYLQFNTFTHAFEVYDVLEDSIIFREFLSPGYGQIAITPNGKYVFYTNACRDGTYFPQVLGFTVFDVDANRVDHVVSDNDFFTGSNWIGPPLSMAVTPDSRWLVMLGGCSIAQGVLYLYDIQRGQLVHREFDEGGWNIFTGLTVQNAR